MLSRVPVSARSGVGHAMTPHSLDFPSIPLVIAQIGVGTLGKYIQFPLVAI